MSEDNGAWLRDVVTGEVFVYRGDFVTFPFDDDEDPTAFWWTEGNGACNCNRINFFYRDRDLPYPPGISLRDDGGPQCTQPEGERIALDRLVWDGWLMVEDGEELDIPRRVR